MNKSYCRAIVSDGNLRWEYKHKGAKVAGSESHDEDVSEWTERDIIKLTRQVLDLKDDENVEVIYD